MSDDDRPTADDLGRMDPAVRAAGTHLMVLATSGVLIEQDADAIYVVLNELARLSTSGGAS